MTRRSRREVREDDLVLISFLYERSNNAKSGIYRLMMHVRTFPSDIENSRAVWQSCLAIDVVAVDLTPRRLSVPLVSELV
jgi:hypothetical protein